MRWIQLQGVPHSKVVGSTEAIALHKASNRRQFGSDLRFAMVTGLYRFWLCINSFNNSPSHYNMLQAPVYNRE
jgi:hypothetical protein